MKEENEKEFQPLSTTAKWIKCILKAVFVIVFTK